MSNFPSCIVIKTTNLIFYSTLIFNPRPRYRRNTAKVGVNHQSIYQLNSKQFNSKRGLNIPRTPICSAIGICIKNVFPTNLNPA